MKKYALNDDRVVVIIGSGAGGGTLGHELAEQGVDVVCLEAGNPVGVITKSSLNSVPTTITVSRSSPPSMSTGASRVGAKRCPTIPPTCQPPLVPRVPVWWSWPPR